MIPLLKNVKAYDFISGQRKYMQQVDVLIKKKL